MVPMMDNRSDNLLVQHYAATLDWWRDAGVDYTFEDEAVSWLSEPEGQKPAPPPQPALDETMKEALPEPSIVSDNLPKDLESFRSWWLAPESPLPVGSGPRIAPRGKAGASMMFVVTMPEAQDCETLFSGPQGRLLVNIARALGQTPDDIYLASALPGHMTLPDWDALGADGLGQAISRHVELAAPQRVILFGSRLPTLMGHERAAAPEQFSDIAGIPALCTFAPDRLLNHAPQRARLWHRLLEWTSQ